MATQKSVKFRTIQSNNRGLITKVGDKTFHSRKPKKGEEYKDVKTLFIWVKGSIRYAARGWTRWTGEKIKNDYIYEVTKFRNIIDISGQNKFHLWSSKNLLEELWEMKGKVIIPKNYDCPNPEEIWSDNRNKKIKYITKRKKLIIEELKLINHEEKQAIKEIYKQKNKLNKKAKFIKYHIDHIIPLSKGGRHKFKNLRIVKAKINLQKGSKLYF